MTRGRDPTPEEEAQDRERTKELMAEGYFDNPERAKEMTEKIDTTLALAKINNEYEGFIFDESKVLRNKDFFFCKLDQNHAGIGLFLPKNLTIKNKEGYISTQKNIPVIIYSNPKEGIKSLLSLSTVFQNEQWKIKFSNIPDESVFPRRWNLTNIQHYLAGLYGGESLSVIFSKIKATYKQFCVFENDVWYSIHALWDIGTYFYKLFDYYAILELRGQMATGKTKVMGISRTYSFNPTQELTNPSESTLFREGGKTQYLDEAEKIFYRNPKSGQMESDTRAEIINSGFKKSGCVPRQEKRGDKFVTINFSAYAPRMIASINGLFGATEDRSIIHTTTPAPKTDERAELELNEDDADHIKTRCELHVALLENWQEIEYAYKNFRNETSLKQRDLNLWKPILILAQQIDSQLYDEVKEFAEQLSEIKKISKVDEDSLDFWIYKLSFNLLADGDCKLDLSEVMKGLPEQYAKVKARTVSSIIDKKLGLREQKRKSNGRIVWDISLEKLKTKLESYYPGILLSLSSLSSLSNIKESDEGVNLSDKSDEMILEESDESAKKTESDDNRKRGELST